MKSKDDNPRIGCITTFVMMILIAIALYIDVIRNR